MTAPMLMTDCPTEETLAAYIDDRLDAPTRRKVTEHISSCGECREIVLMTTDYQMSETPANVVRGKFGGIAAAASLAAAAVIAVFALQPAFLFAPDMDDVFTAAQKVKSRPSLARLAGEFPHKPQAKVYRSANETKPLDPQKIDLYSIAAEAKDSHVKGVALMLTAQTGEEFKEAVTELEAAYAGASGEKRDAIAIDLAAALLTYDGWTNDKTFAKRALTLLDDLSKRRRTPDVAWNRAIALESVGSNDDAIQAWDDYLALDRSSEWAKEAASRRRELVEFKR